MEERRLPAVSEDRGGGCWVCDGSGWVSLSLSDRGLSWPSRARFLPMHNTSPRSHLPSQPFLWLHQACLIGPALMGGAQPDMLPCATMVMAYCGPAQSHSVTNENGNWVIWFTESFVFMLEIAGVFPGFHSAVKTSSSVFKILKLAHRSSQLHWVVWIRNVFFHIKRRELELEVTCSEVSVIITFSISLYLFLSAFPQSYNCLISVNVIHSDGTYTDMVKPLSLMLLRSRVFALNEKPREISFTFQEEYVQLCL